MHRAFLLSGSGATVAGEAPPEAMNPLAPFAGLMLSSLVWGLSWWPIRWLDAHGLHVLWATAALYLVPTLVVLARYRRQVAPWLREPMFWLLVAAAGLTNVAFNWGVLVGEVIRVVLLFYLMPVWAVGFARLLLGERPDRGTFGRILLALAGAMTILWQAEIGLPVPRSAGDWLGLAGGVFFALNNVMLRRLATAPTSVRSLGIFAGGLLLPAGFALVFTGTGIVAAPPALAPDWLLGVAGLAAAVVAGNLALQYGASRLPAEVTAVVLLGEVLVAAVSAVLIGGETLDLRTLAGGGLIMAAALAAGLGPARRARAPA